MRGDVLQPFVGEQESRALTALSSLKRPLSLDACFSVLKASSSGTQNALHRAKLLSAYLIAHRSEHVTDCFGNQLVLTLAKCGALQEAAIFSTAFRPRLTVLSWTALISAYTDHGSPADALRMYQRMQIHGVEPNTYTFVAVLKACSLTRDLMQGQRFYVEICKKGLGSDLFINNTILSMFGKNGAIDDADCVFRAMPFVNSSSWNAMLSSYVGWGRPKQALEMFAQMCKDGIELTAHTFVSVLKACAQLTDHEHGKEFHALSHREGFTSNIFVLNSLICMYGKCRDIATAEKLFCTLSNRTRVSWNAMLSAYVEARQGHNALLLYRQMQHEGMSPDCSTLLIILQAAILAGEKEILVNKDPQMQVMSLEVTQAVHSYVHKNSYALNTCIRNSLISIYGKCGAVKEAENVFCRSSSKNDVITWSAMLSAYAENGYEILALQIYVQMQVEDTIPNEQTLVSAIQACGLLAESQDAQMMSLEIGQLLHADATKQGFTSNIFICNTIISMYGKCKAIIEAKHVFETMNQYTAMSWSAMFSAYVGQGFGHRALDLYAQMQKESVILDNVTLLCVIQACGILRALERCRHHHMEIVFLGYDQMASMSSTLISVYGSCISILDAKALFDKLVEPDIVAWNAFMASYAEIGDYVSCLQTFEKLKQSGTKPNAITFVSILSACSHCGLVCQGLQYFDSISRDYGIFPDLKHYNSIIQLLAHAGDFKLILLIMEQMPVEPNLTTWLLLLNSCCAYGILYTARQAFDGAFNCNPCKTSEPVILSHLYTEQYQKMKDKEMNKCLRIIYQHYP